MKIRTLFITLCTMLSISLQAEVSMVIITWAPQVCQEACGRGLHKYLSEIPQVADVAIDLNGGSATLKWKPNQPYSFVPIDFATRVIGIPRILTARMRVRGTVQHNQDVFNLISIGDNTAIRLLSPIQPQPGRYVIQTSIDNHKLTEEMKEKLLEIESKQELVTVEGPIFEPVRSLFPAVIIEYIKAEKKEKAP